MKKYYIIITVLFYTLIGVSVITKDPIVIAGTAVIAVIYIVLTSILYITTK